MHFEGRRRTSDIPNLTPLIDIVFLLLVFFMLTSHFIREETIPIELPDAETSDPLEPNELVKVTLDDKGSAFVGKQRVAFGDLESRLRNELRTRKEKVVQIRGDQAAGLGNAVKVLDAARKAGAKSVDIVTEEKR